MGLGEAAWISMKPTPSATAPNLCERVAVGLRSSLNALGCIRAGMVRGTTEGYGDCDVNERPAVPSDGSSRSSAGFRKLAVVPRAHRPSAAQQSMSSAMSLTQECRYC